MTISLAEKSDVLRELEQFYTVMLSAQENTNRAFIWFSGLPHPYFNIVTRFSCDSNLSENIDSIINKAPQGLPLAFWVHPLNSAKDLKVLLKKRGFSTTSPAHAMAWQVGPVEAPESDIRKSNNKDFYDIIGKAFHLDEETNAGYARLLENVDTEDYLIYSKGVPVGTGTLIANETLNGIFNISVLPDYQKNGFGKAMMQFLMRRAYDLKIKRLVLRSAPGVELFYQKLGFIKYFDIEIFTLSRARAPQVA